jgi:hypothetical protein
MIMARAFEEMSGGRAAHDRDGLNDLRLIGLHRLASEAMSLELSNDQVSELLSESELLREMAASIRRLVKELIERLDAKNAVLSLVDQSQVRPRSICDVEHDNCDRPSPRARTALPDPRLIRMIIRQRQQRARYFDGDLFADPAWDMLLDLAAVRAEHQRVSVTSLSIASGVPLTTALRWIGLLTDAGLCERIEDNVDRRRAFIVLTDQGTDAIARYFEDLGDDRRFLT